MRTRVSNVTKCNERSLEYIPLLKKNKKERYCYLPLLCDFCKILHQNASIRWGSRHNAHFCNLTSRYIMLTSCLHQKFQSYIKTEKCYIFCQLTTKELTIMTECNKFMTFSSHNRHNQNQKYSGKSLSIC